MPGHGGGGGGGGGGAGAAWGGGGGGGGGAGGPGVVQHSHCVHCSPAQVILAGSPASVLPSGCDAHDTQELAQVGCVQHSSAVHGTPLAPHPQGVSAGATGAT